jgi:hypothetical protein
MSTYNNDMVCHVWAQGNEDSGKNGNGSLYFTGDTIYSYGSHFPIAKMMDNGMVLFTTDTHGVTTSQHCSRVRQAISNRKTFDVPCVEITPDTNHRYTKERNAKSHKENLASYKERINDTVVKASRARSNKEWLENLAIVLVDEHNSYINVFSLRNKPIELPNVGQLRAAADKAAAKAAKIAAIENADKIAKWLAGENVSLPRNIAVMLRVRGDMVQTSQNASFPIEHARLALKIIKRCKANKEKFVPNGKTIKLGHFAIDRIDTNGDVKAGCHFVKYAQIVRIEKDLQ